MRVDIDVRSLRTRLTPRVSTPPLRQGETNQLRAIQWPARRRWAIFRAIFSSSSGPTRADHRLNPHAISLIRPLLTYCGDKSHLTCSDSHESFKLGWYPCSCLLIGLRRVATVTQVNPPCSGRAGSCGSWLGSSPTPPGIPSPCCPVPQPQRRGRALPRHDPPGMLETSVSSETVHQSPPAPSRGNAWLITYNYRRRNHSDYMRGRTPHQILTDRSRRAS
jgi:hypothetical protein